MFIKAEIGVELNTEQQTKVTIHLLKNDYEAHLRDVMYLMSKPSELENFEIKDLEYSISVMRSILVLLEYYSEDYEEWIKKYNFDPNNQILL